jgi:hypothetical protein
MSINKAIGDRLQAEGGRPKAEGRLGDLTNINKLSFHHNTITP